MVKYRTFSFSHRMNAEIENLFRMGQVLQIQDQLEMSINKFISVCEKTESVLLEHPDEMIQFHWCIYSLQYISDIYGSQKMFKKACAFKNAQHAFLQFVKDHPEIQELKVNGNIDRIHSIFSAFHSAVESSNTDEILTSEVAPDEDQKEIVQKIQQLMNQNQEYRMNALFEQIERNTRQKEKLGFVNSLINFVVDHYFITIFLLLLLASFVIGILVHYNPRIRNQKMSADLARDMEQLHKLVKNSGMSSDKYTKIDFLKEFEKLKKRSEL